MFFLPWAYHYFSRCVPSPTFFRRHLWTACCRLALDRPSAGVCHAAYLTAHLHPGIIHRGNPLQHLSPLWVGAPLFRQDGNTNTNMQQPTEEETYKNQVPPPSGVGECYLPSETSDRSNKNIMFSPS